MTCARAQADIAAGEVLLRSRTSRSPSAASRRSRDVSFDIRKGEIRAIIGPNGAGKTSMLNVINGFYTPQQGRITFKGRTRAQDAALRGGARRHRPDIPERRAVQGHDRRSTTSWPGRTLKMRRGLFWQLLRHGPALKEEVEHRRKGRGHHRFPRNPAHPQGRRSASCPTACRSASNSAARLPWSPICCCSTSRWPA